MTIIHVLEPFASGVTTAVCAITGELPDFVHIVVHGQRNWTEESQQAAVEKVKQRFPPSVSFIEWKNATREINLINDFKALNELVTILKPFKKEKIVVHLHSSKAGFLGRVACNILGIKTVIYTPHCGAFLRTDVSKFKRRQYRFFEQFGSCFGGRIVGCGPSEGMLYKKLGKNTTFVSNGVNIKKGIKADNERKLICFTGIASTQKDTAFWNAIAKACAQNAQKEGFSFCWIGDGPLASEIDQTIIQLTGWKTPDEVEEYLSKTAIYLSTSAWEGLPYGVLEAMNFGCALLLRDVPGNRELVVTGENGRLFDTKEEAIYRLNSMMKNKSHLLDMGKKSKDVLEKNYSIRQMGEGYRKVYIDAQGLKN